MSRQRPYRTFEEGFFIFLLGNDRLRIRSNTLLSEMKGFKELNADMRLPWTFLTYDKELVGFWSSMCQMFGEWTKNPIDCYIPAKNLSMAIEWFEDCIERARLDLL